MPHTHANNPDGSTSVNNVQTGRDTVRWNADDTYFHASVQAAPRLFDDFIGKTMTTQVSSTKGSDGGCVDWANVVNLNGTAVATTGAGAGATMAVNGVQLDGSTAGLQWKASGGGLTYEARFKTSAITTVALFVGLTDQVASLEMPMTLSVTTFTTTATDAVGFLFDTAATTVTIRCMSVKNDTDTTVPINTGLAYVADTYRVFRIEVNATGDAFFWIDGNYQGTIPNAVTTSVFLTPVIAGFSRAASSRTLSADYLLTQATRV